MRKSCSSWNFLQNEYLIAKKKILRDLKIGIDRAKNEPSKVWPACLLEDTGILSLGPPTWVNSTESKENVWPGVADQKSNPYVRISHMFLNGCSKLQGIQYCMSSGSTKSRVMLGNVWRVVGSRWSSHDTSVERKISPTTNCDFTRTCAHASKT